MLTTDNLRYSGITCSLLLPELERIWLPDHSAVHDENSSRSVSEPARKLRTPPLILFLEGLPDVFTPGELSPGKRLPCGHVVSLNSIIDGCNFFGDDIWTPAPHCFGCAEPECEDLLEYPKIPDPRVVDGLEARLDLIEWSWKNVKPTKPEKNVVSLLRDILSRIGHLSREPEPETYDEASRPKPSKSSLKQTLVNMEREAFSLMVEHEGKSAEIPVRGTQPYCSYRTPRVPSAHVKRLYPTLSPGQECEYVTPHEDVREASSWALTPAETDCDDDAPKDEKNKKKRKMDSDHEEPKDKKHKKRKTVRFVAPVVTQVQYFEPWCCDEYRDSDRYWSSGPSGLSADLSTSADDDREIELLEKHDGLALRDQDSECSTLVDDEEEEEVLGEMDRAGEVLDEDILDELDAGIEEESSWDEIDGLEALGGDFF